MCGHVCEDLYGVLEHTGREDCAPEPTVADRRRHFLALHGVREQVVRGHKEQRRRRVQRRIGQPVKQRHRERVQTHRAVVRVGEEEETPRTSGDEQVEQHRLPQRLATLPDNFIDN